jgi:hypothetical protein
MRATTAFVLACLLAAPLASADKKQKSHGQGGPPPGKGSSSGAATVTVGFSTGEREAAHAWFVESYGRGNCPPGLAKKNNGCLPPGQAKKRYAVGHPLGADVRWSPLPPALSTRVGPAPSGYMYVTLDGDLLKLAAGTMLVVDAVQGFVN